MHDSHNRFTIGALAKATAVNVETLRFYQRKDLLPVPERPVGGIRRYGDAEVARVRFIKAAQRLGFSLEEVADLLTLEDGTHCLEARSVAEHKIKEVRQKLLDLHSIETVLGQLIACCDSTHGAVKCPLIASLQQDVADIRR
jgi:MerR family transcriptional regulator, mercuric resistance operon regulatory protein